VRVERDADGRLRVVDSSFLINFLAVDRMDILAVSGSSAFTWSTTCVPRSDMTTSAAAASRDGGWGGDGDRDHRSREIRLYDELRHVLETASRPPRRGRQSSVGDCGDEKGRFRRELFTGSGRATCWIPRRAGHGD